MMTSKFKLDVAPTFPATVEIPVPGGGVAPVKVEFKHHTKDQMDELFDREASIPDNALMLKILASWELDEPLNEESVHKLLQNYQGAAIAITRKFVDEIGPARLGN